MNDLLQIVASDTPRRYRLVGELDASNADDLLGELQKEVEAGGDLVLELSELSFVDSMGLRSFLRIAAALDSSGKLILEHPVRAVARTIHLAGLHKAPSISVVGGLDIDRGE